MTQNIIVSNPSKRVIQTLEALRDKKQQQLKKLSEMKECTFTIKV